jgi:flavodoxin short chain
VDTAILSFHLWKHGIRYQNKGFWCVSALYALLPVPSYFLLPHQLNLIMENIMKVLIVYGSTTGNTASIAEALGEQISTAGHEVKVQNAADARAAGLCNSYDAVLFGCSAWGTDEVEMQEDFNALFEEFDAIGVQGKKVACFASGDSSFEHFCGAVNVLEDRLTALDAVLMDEGLKVEGDYSGNKADVDEWGKRIIAALG